MRTIQKVEIINKDIPFIDDSIVSRFKKHDVAKISDAMAKYGTFKSEVKPLDDVMRICGQCVTVKCNAGDYKSVLKASKMVRGGQILVVDAGGYSSVAVAGLDTVKILESNNAGGLVVYGAVRDKCEILKTKFPVFCSSLSLRRINNTGVLQFNVPINGAGLVVYPGDLIVGDDDGVVAVPSYDVERVICLTDAKLEHELSNQAKINAGAVMTVLYGCEAKIDKWREPK